MSKPESKGGIERRVHDRVDANLGVTWARITEQKATEMLEGGEFIEIFSLLGFTGESSEAALERQAYTENLSMSGVKLVGDLRLSTGEPLEDGWHLAVTLDVPGAPLAVRAVAVAVWTTPLAADGKTRTAGLFFQGIHKGDSERVARFIAEKQRHNVTGNA